MTQNINDLTAFFVNAFYDDMSRIKASTGFLSRWGKGAGSQTIRVNDSLEFSMDIVRNKKRIGKLYPRSQAEAATNLGSNVKTRTGQVFENVARDFPIIRMNANVSHDQAMKYRLPGELAIKDTQSSDGQGIITRAGIELGRAVKVNMIQAVGRMELMAAEALRTGVITLDDGTTYDFGRASTNTDIVGTTWDNTSTALPFADLSAHYTVVRRNGKGDPKAVVMSGNSFNAFLNTTEVKNSTDNRDVEFVRAGDVNRPLPGADFIADMEANGFSYMAYYKDLTTGRKMYIFVYDQDYQDVDSSDAWTNYMPDDKVLFFDPEMRLDRFFGPRIRFNYVTPEERLIRRIFGIDSMLSMPDTLGNGAVESWMFHHDVITNGSEKTSIGIESYTGPLYAPTEVDSAGELTVL